MKQKQESFPNQSSPLPHITLQIKLALEYQSINLDTIKCENINLKCNQPANEY